MINFDDPSIAIALLLIIAGFRLALYVFEHMQTRESVQTAAPVISPDDNAEEISAQESDTSEIPLSSQHANHYRFINEVLEAAFIAVFLVFLLIRPFVLQAFYIPSGSMKPTLLEGDKLLATKFTYVTTRHFRFREPRLGEIVVFHAPPEAIETLDKEPYDPKHPTDYVKRVIGVPGDRIRIKKNIGVFVNGKKLKEPYIADIPDYDFPINENNEISTNTEITAAFSQDQKNAYIRVRDTIKPFVSGKELIVPKGYLFVLGDNRIFSHDGHKWGLLPRKALVGKAQFIFWPPKRIGFVR